MIRISQWKRRRGLRQKPPKLLFAVEQSLSSQILAITAQQVECKEARVPTAKQEIFELWSATSIKRANLAINDCSPVRQGIRDCFCQRRKRSERMPVASKSVDSDRAQ